MNALPVLYVCCAASYPALLALLETLAQNKQTAPSYVYFESEAAIEMLPYQLPAPDWTHGRAFGAQCEVRWDKQDTGYELLLLTESALTLPEPWRCVTAAEGVPLPDKAVADQMLLWGTHISRLKYPHHLAEGEGNAWIETRIPRPLRYPVDDAPPPEQVKARVMRYYCRERLLLTRMIAVEGEYDGPQILW
ncbi:MAG: hypothetical protein JXR84_06310 [Anaerolineae bacterium]|nr:hypothetical protein [Anaerolineae bacterium]